ncbi:hypothetical protein ACLB0R_10160 [Sphingomonas sp. GlSt437]|uniref:hypothetical protein n=1 Tax=Sphingomonas sp. GlSt437 TaxID=3389970 RepID=UPI003A8B4D8D
MRKAILAATMLALSVGAPAALAAPCKDAKGKFIKCPPPKPVKTTRCRLNGKFVSCTTKGAKPA